jgi:esterase/lipase superfamily enzyme
MAISRRAKSASVSRVKIRAALLRYFRARLLKPARIGASSNVKKLCGYARSPDRWRRLARDINKLSVIKDSGLRLRAAAMADISTIADMIGELFPQEPPQRQARRPKVRRKKAAARKARPRAAKRPPKKKAGGERIKFTGAGRFLQESLPDLRGNVTIDTLRQESQPGTRLEPQVDATYPVWYGTNRAPRDATDSSKGYSAERDSKVHLGRCEVFIPKSHKIGSTGSSWWARLKSGVDDRLRLLSISELSPEVYWAQIATYPLEDRDAVIFVHGYNVSFESAALRAGQIGFDLSIKGCMAFFSWPSQGSIGGYITDEASIEASELAIMQFMIDFATRSDAPRVHIIAHSMGNRGVLRAVDRMASHAQAITGKRFGQIILAAPDVDADTFRNLSTAYVNLSQRTTLYVSTRDHAVEASQWLHSFPRAGLVPPIMIVPGIDTINVTNADLTMLGHGYVAESRSVLEDMHRLIVHGDPPERRFGLHEEKIDGDQRYWLIRQ